MSVPNFSEYGEQEFITNFFNGVTGRFLDIGAWDGVDRSNTHALALMNWSGVCVEASPFIFHRLVQNYKDNPRVTCVNAAVMPKNGIVEFYDTYNLETQIHGHTSTCLRDNNVKDLIQRKYCIAAIEPYDLSHFSPFQMVSIDIEGLDIPVLKELRPLLEDTDLIVVEDTIPGAPFDEGYYKQLMDACAMHGFTKVVGRTHGPEKPANTLLTRP